jgi:uncharacterized protein YecE (DUF72 family)
MTSEIHSTQLCLIDEPANELIDINDSLEKVPNVPLHGKASPQKQGVQPITTDEAVNLLAQHLPSNLYLGTSSWYFPGWQDLVWRGMHAEQTLSRTGLTAYAAHPLLRTVSIDSSFYRPLALSTYERYAKQTPNHFRFMVKAPALFCDAMIRPREGNGVDKMGANPDFLNAALAMETFVKPASQGLGTKAAVLVFQLSPIPSAHMPDPATLLHRLQAFMQALPPAPGTYHAVELRNANLLTPQWVKILKATGWHYCLGLHAFMPPIEQQLPLLRALWPAPLICRWSLQRGLKYEEAKNNFHPFNQLVAPDIATRTALARVVAGTVKAGQAAFVTINNKAEGSAPLSVQALAQAVVDLNENALI